MLPVELIQPIPKPGDAGFFGALRKFDIHTGIDLYTNEDEPVRCIRSGTVVGIENFTGEHADSPWWNNTWAILVEDDEGVIVYGELEPCTNIEVGAQVERTQIIGHIRAVLKTDKGKNPTTMLHLEHYTKGTRKTVWWNLGNPQPENLLNPVYLFNTLALYKHVVVFPDWFATGVWDMTGCCVPLDMLPVSDRIKDMIRTMVQEFDSCGFTDYNSGSYYTCPDGVNYMWDDRCKEIVELIKYELPDWTVSHHEL